MAGEAGRRLTYLNKVLNEKDLTDKAYPVFRNKTPVASGNAKRKTTKTSQGIKANYPYAGRLDEGYSKKSPKGMTRPTIDHLRRYLKRKLK